MRSSRAGTIAPSRLLASDALRVGAIGLKSRRLRAGLSALGIAIGIASMVAVLGISESSKADLLATLDRLGTNLLTVAPGQTFLGEDAELPETAAGMIGRIGAVQRAASVKTLDQTVRRTDFIDEAITGGIAVAAADPGVPSVLGARLRAGRFLDEATARYPTVVLGSIAARRLGISRPGVNVWLGDHWFTVIGILRRVTLDPNLDSTALIGYPVADRLVGADRSATTIYVRAADDSVQEVRSLLGATANPEYPEEVQVSRPSDVLTARAAAKSAFTSLFLGLGAVALLVGGVGIANVMVISVLERRSEIGLRRALGATRRHISVQFLSESLLLAGAGGVAGALLGALVTLAYASSRGWTVDVPAEALAGGAGAALAIGAGLAQVIDSEPGLRADIAAPGDDPLSTLPANWADVILLDSPLASHDAFEICHLLKQLAAPRRVALYTERGGEQVGLAAWVAGADALIEKSVPPPVLFERLRVVARGGRVLPSPSARALTSAARELDAAERVVFGMCVYGVTLGEISRTLRRDPLEIEATARELIRRLASVAASPGNPHPRTLPSSRARSVAG